VILGRRSCRKITIVGVGLIGGSLGLAIKKHRLAKEVAGLSYNQDSLEAALNNRAIDVGFTDVGKAIRHADMVILASPVDSIIRLLPAINPYLKRGCVVTDVGSAKVEIVEAAQKKLSDPRFFVGAHPMAGSEKTGSDHARADMFEGSLCLMTPLDSTHKNAVNKVKWLWSSLGAKVKRLSAEEHDEIMAYVSHLPHVVAYAMMSTIPTKHLSYAGQGLKDTTRIAASSAQMWNDICMANAKNVVKGLDEMVRNLAELRQAIVHHDQKRLIRDFNTAREKREKI